MSNGPLVKISAATAAEVCARFTLPSESRKLLQEGMTPGAFTEALIAKKQCVPAIDFMAHALPAREGIWWGCLCLQHAYGDNLSPPERAAATAAVRWVLQPADETRAAAKAPAEAAGPATPAGALAMAVILTGAPSAKAVANAVKLASLKSQPTQVAGTQQSFVALAMDLAAGRYI